MLVALSLTGYGQNMIPKQPTGWLSAYPTIVQTGTKPQLSWSIAHPSTAKSYLTWGSPGLVVESNNTVVTIRMIGVGVEAGGQSVPSQALVALNASSAKSVFLGTSDEIKPNEIVWQQVLKNGDTLTLGGRYYFGGGWSTTYTSANGTNVRLLRNGDAVPLLYSLNKPENVMPFMTPYLDGGGKVKIGPLDVLIMAELTQNEANVGTKGYNLQDVVMLLSAAPKGNNGHGNNVDGVDSSNPGNSGAKKYDTNAAIDDEKSRK